MPEKVTKLSLSFFVATLMSFKPCFYCYLQEKNENGTCHKPCKQNEACFSVFKMNQNNFSDASHIKRLKQGCLATSQHEECNSRWVVSIIQWLGIWFQRKVYHFYTTLDGLNKNNINVSNRIQNIFVIISIVQVPYRGLEYH